MAIAVLVKHRVGSHNDQVDFLDGWTAMCCFGEFSGGDLCLPGIEVEDFEGQAVGEMRLRYRPGDVIFLRASLLEHFLTRFDGKRKYLVIFTKGTC